MNIKAAETKNAELYIDNTTITGKILEIDRKGDVCFELNKGSPFSTSEMGKRAELFFEQENKKYFIAGRIFFQPPSKVIIKPDTDAEIEKRDAKRSETPSLPATILYHGIFHKRYTIRGTVINISMKGARVETAEQLKDDISYTIIITLPFHHTSFEFQAPFIVRNHQHYRNIFINGISFTDMDIESENRLKKYLFGEKMKM